MSTQTTLLFPDGSSPQQLWMKSIPDEEFADLMDLSNEAAGIYTKLRFYALRNGGLPENLEEVWPKVRNFLRMNRQKFDRLWPEVRAKFQLSDGLFFVARDDERLSSSREKVIKSREYGKLGAEQRWKRNTSSISHDTNIPMATPSATPMLTDQTDQTRLDRPEGTEGLTMCREIPPPPSSAEVEVFSSTLSTPLSSPPSVTDSEVQALEQHCRNLNLPPPGRKLCQRLKQKFHPVPVAEFLKQLPRFENQNSPGLWADPALTPRILAEEAERQKNPPPLKKPVKAQPKDPYICVWDLEAAGIKP